MVTVVLTRDESTVVIKKVTGQVCTLCGEYELDSDILKSVLVIAESAFQKHAEVEIVRYVLHAPVDTPAIWWTDRRGPGSFRQFS
jgi:YgiT-type zinc finger domain-containing protein